MKMTEMYKYSEDGKTFKIQVPITRPGKDININKISFDIESYINVMNSEEVKKALESNQGLPFVFKTPKNFTSGIDGSLCIGKVVAWNPEFIIVEISVDNYNRYIAPYNESTDMKAGILATGNFLEGSKEIFCIDKVYGFQVLYGISAKSLEKIEKEAEDNKEESKAEEVVEEKEASVEEVAEETKE